MLQFMPESDNWQLEKDFVTTMYETYYYEYVAEVDKNDREMYRNALRSFRRAKRKFKRKWHKMSDDERTKMARQHYFGDRRMPGTFKQLRPAVLK